MANPEATKAQNFKAFYAEATRSDSLLAYQKTAELFEELHQDANDKIPFQTYNQAFMTYVNLGLLEKAENVHNKFTIYENKFLDTAGPNARMNGPTPCDRLIRKFAILNLKWDLLEVEKPKTVQYFVEAMETFDQKSVQYEVGHNWIVQERIQSYLYQEECKALEKQCTEVYRQIDAQNHDINCDHKADFKGYFCRVLDRMDRPIMKEFMDLYRFAGRNNLQIDLAQALRTGVNPSFQFNIGF